MRLGLAMRAVAQCGAGLILSVALVSPAHADCDDPIDGPWDTGVDAEADCDGDGFTPGTGDCDDRDAEVHPGQDETCGDEIDNDCDGFVDGGCGSAATGSLQGGASCVQSSGSGALAVFLLPGLALGLRRRKVR